MSRSNIQTRKIQPMIQRYGLAVVAVAIAFESALFLASHNFQGVEFPLFLFAIALTAWYGGTGPAILALVLSSLACRHSKPSFNVFIRMINPYLRKNWSEQGGNGQSSRWTTGSFIPAAKSEISTE